ncbi:DUF4197 domain-containing protein [Marinobacterium litorale]|uniref:DUF4197 domain-containing protein n=1 Tax=Marinobacterium litorale TaxID=404770 RepID=UPI000409150E|nr:DUF4197 domain-containing protein [Marinobacterium litorale]
MTKPALVTLIPLFFALAQTSPAQADWKKLLNQGETLIHDVTNTSPEGEAPPEGVENSTLTSGLREALAVGTQRAVEQLAKTDGYMGNADVKIPLPGMLHTTANMFRRAGLSSQVEAFELSMNRAAEGAVTEAAPIFSDAISTMTLEDVRRIYSGGDTAATEYFRERTYSQLKERFQPKIETAMNENGVTSAYNTLLDMAKNEVALLGNLNLDLGDHVTEKALDGLFTVLAQEEKRIRQDPAARTTELLKKVFAN